MAVKPARWCSRCKAAHTDRCPQVKAWEKPVHQKSGRGGRPWQRKRQNIFERDGYVCQSCGRVVTLHGTFTGICDHITPKAEGGTDDDSNLQTLCRMCSDEKTHAESMKSRL